MQPITRETIVDRRQPQMRWSAVFAGATFAIGLWILLQVLGMGLGLSAVDTDDSGSLRGVGIGTGIWSVIAPLIAMFAGAFLAGRLANTRDRGVGAMHGSVMWALATAVGLWAMFTLVSTMASGVTRVGGAAMSATSTIVSGAASAGAANSDDAMKALGIDTNDLLGPVNQRLQREGKPTVTTRELNATIRAVAQRGLHDGTLDQQVLIDELARNTRLSRADAQDIANEFGARYQELSTRVQTGISRIGERAEDVALEAADKTGKVLLVGGLMMLLSLGAAIAGSALGARPKTKTRTPTGTTTIRTGDVPPLSPDYPTRSTPTDYVPPVT